MRDTHTQRLRKPVCVHSTTDQAHDRITRQVFAVLLLRSITAIDPCQVFIAELLLWVQEMVIAEVGRSET